MDRYRHVSEAFTLTVTLEHYLGEEQFRWRFCDATTELEGTALTVRGALRRARRAVRRHRRLLRRLAG